MYVIVGTEKLLLGFVRRDLRTAEAGADGIDEDQVGEAEPGAGIVGELRGIGGAVALSPNSDAWGRWRRGSERRRGAGPTVEGESDRTVWAVDVYAVQTTLPVFLPVSKTGSAPTVTV